jgi:hypothetical protein
VPFELKRGVSTCRIRLFVDEIPPALREQPWMPWRAEPRGDSKPGEALYRLADPIARA